jgi:hypothetical protein
MSTVHCARKRVFIGGSNLDRIATTNVCTQSSVPTSKPGKIDAVIEKVAQLKLNATDVIITDFIAVLI